MLFGVIAYGGVHTTRSEPVYGIQCWSFTEMTQPMKTAMMTNTKIDIKKSIQPKDAFKTIEELEEKLKTLSPNQYKLLRLKNNLPLYNGALCRMVSVANALNYYIETKAINCSLPPVRKRPDNNPYSPNPAPVSLRQIAKKTAGSQVGEFYTQDMVVQFVKGIGKELKNTPLETAAVDFHNLDSPQAYVNHIKTVIDKGQPAIIYYDMDRSENNYAQPLQDGTGEAEHSATVMGYFLKDNKLFFILAHIGVYSIVQGDQLAISASHLLACRATPQDFYKIKTSAHKTRWTPRLELFEDRYRSEYDKIKQAAAKSTFEEKISRSDGTHLTLFKRVGFLNEDKKPGFKCVVCTITPGL